MNSELTREWRKWHNISVYNQTARPFNWKFTAADLARLLDRISAREHAAQNPAKLPEAA